MSGETINSPWEYRLDGQVVDCKGKVLACVTDPAVGRIIAAMPTVIDALRERLGDLEAEMSDVGEMAVPAL
jgi:hypothetical protein